MKYALVCLLILTALTTACVRLPTANVPPVAIIDSVSPTEVYTGDTIKFIGHGVSTNGQIIGYNWRSSINGNLSKQASFDVSTLSAGQHTVWFSVQDNYGNWSQEIATNVIVDARTCAAKMSINTFTATPPAIVQGDYTNLTWDVSGDGTVRIDPDVGNVAYSGSRSIQPQQNTVYTLYATNDAGISTATAAVSVSPSPLTTVVMYPVAAECGTIWVATGAFNSSSALVGEDKDQQQMQAIMSWDISAIPYNAVVKSVQIDVSKAHIYNYPFPFQGDLFVYNLKYGQLLNDQNQITFVPSTAIFRWGTNQQITTMPVTPFSSVDINAAVQRQIDTHNSRFQVRMQLERYYHYNVWDLSSTTYSAAYQPNGNVGNYIDVSSGNPTLIVSYILQ